MNRAVETLMLRFSLDEKKALEALVFVAKEWPGISAQIADAKPRGPISDELKKKVCDMVEAGIPTLIPLFAKTILKNLAR